MEGGVRTRKCPLVLPGWLRAGGGAPEGNLSYSPRPRGPGEGTEEGAALSPQHVLWAFPDAPRCASGGWNSKAIKPASFLRTGL